jgi:hypothetical protein
VEGGLLPEFQFQGILEEAGQGVVIGLIEIFDLGVLLPGVQQFLERTDNIGLFPLP